MKNIAAAVVSEDINFEDYTSILDGNYVSLIVGENGEHSLPRPLWKEHDDLSPLSVSDNSVIEVIMRPNRETSGGWQAHEMYEFCLAGTAVNSTYDYHPGSAIFSQYDKYIFYDMALGGINTMDQLLVAQEADEPSSCSSYTHLYTGGS